MKSIRGVFFDLHGTLLLSSDLASAWEDWLEAFHACMAERGLSMSKEEFTPYAEGLFEKPEPEYENAEMTLFERRVKDLGHRLGLDIDREHVRWTVEHIIGVWHRDMYLDPETHEALEALGSRLRLAMITNWDHAPRIPSLLSELGVDEYFEEVVISDEVGVSKPDPEILPEVLGTYQFGPEFYVPNGSVSVFEKDGHLFSTWGWLMPEGRMRFRDRTYWTQFVFQGNEEGKVSSVLIGEHLGKKE